MISLPAIGRQFSNDKSCFLYDRARARSSYTGGVSFTVVADISVDYLVSIEKSLQLWVAERLPIMSPACSMQ